jgi:anti-sigma factor RsiW
MNCAETELLICDYVDGTLTKAQTTQVNLHLSVCPACTELARDCAAAVRFIEKAQEVEPPAELVTRILFEAPWRKNKPAGLRGRLAGWFRPVLQPKFVMGAAMTILSFSLLSRVTPMRQIKASDLEPKAVWAGLENRVLDVWDRAVKFYDNLKFVYQIQTTLREWQQEDEEQRSVKKPNGKNTDDHKLPAKSSPQGKPAKASGGNH